MLIVHDDSFTNESLQKVVDGIYVTATSAARVDQGFPTG